MQLKSKYSINLADLKPESTAHGSGSKYVFRRNEEMSHPSTQVAFGEFKKGEVCEEHIHPTMYEYFYFIEGAGTYVVGDELIDLVTGTFLEIPSGVPHSLHADKSDLLRFVYWGVATD